ncbi:MAG: LPS export ABC transporter periplasmic protein LptC [Proteobacteria bacterium]|nr:LPS export ABC transporter periplasmic protein LptC [Pseudomonadota bacterium]
MGTRWPHGWRRGAALAGLGFALACGFEPRPVAPVESLELPPAALTQVAFEGYSGEQREVMVRAERATIDPRNRIAKLEGVRVEIAGGEGPPLEIHSARGEFDLARDDFELLDGVTGTTTDGSRFETPVLRYEQESGRLASESAVRLQRPRMTLDAAGMRMDLAERRIRLTGRVVARLKGG